MTEADNIIAKDYLSDLSSRKKINVLHIVYHLEVWLF